MNRVTLGKKLKMFFLASIVLLISGCTGIIISAACLDSKILREPRLHHTIFEIEFIDAKDNKITKNIQCEEYYDAQCSVRGNSWRWRATKHVSPLTTYSDEGDEIKISYPTCSELVENESIGIELFDVEFSPSRDSAEYSSRVGDVFSFYYRKWIGAGIPSEKSYFNITMQLKVKKHNNSE